MGGGSSWLPCVLLPFSPSGEGSLAVFPWLAFCPCGLAAGGEVTGVVLLWGEGGACSLLRAGSGLPSLPLVWALICILKNVSGTSSFIGIF